MADTRGCVVYEGPSLLDESPIVAIATLKTSNRKTGDMVQLWILPADRNPLEAVQEGKNFGACGTCALQGTPTETKNGKAKLQNRACYVNLGQAPLCIYNAWKRGSYPRYMNRLHAHYTCGRKVRLGAYGDPAALPIELLEHLVGLYDGHTGYSHQLIWIPRERADRLAQIGMASCHTPAQHAEAIRRGWRPFTVVADSQFAPDGAVECPAYPRGVQCDRCRPYQGASFKAKPVYVLTHAKNGLNLPAVQESELQAVR